MVKSSYCEKKRNLIYVETPKNFHMEPRKSNEVPTYEVSPGKIHRIILQEITYVYLSFCNMKL